MSYLAMLREREHLQSPRTPRPAPVSGIDPDARPVRDGTPSERAAYTRRDKRLRVETAQELRDLLRRLTNITECMHAEPAGSGTADNVELWTTALDRYESGERLLRALFGYEGCVWGPDRTCPPHQPVACEFCSETGAWRDG